MGTHYEVKWATARPGAVPEASVRAEVDRVLDAVDEAFSTWNEASVLSRFNAHRSTEPFPIPEAHRAAFRAVFALAAEVVERTGGAFDPTLKPLLDVLGFSERDADPPSATDRDAALARTGWRSVRLDDEGLLHKEIPDLALTFDSFVPGWAADRIADAIVGLGAIGCMVDVGGEIVCRGHKPDGEPWVIGIERPAPPGAPTVVHQRLSFTGGLATSGTYRNVRMVDDRLMHHVLDPRTGENVAHPWAAVSVLADSAALADALATAFLVLGPDGAAPVVDGWRDRGVRALFLGFPDDTGRVAERRLSW